MASFLIGANHQVSTENRTLSGPKPNFDLGGAVSTYNVQSQKTGPETADPLYKSQPNLVFSDDCNNFCAKPHRSLLDRPLVAVVMEPSSALGLFDSGLKNGIEESPSAGFKSSFAKEVARGRKAAAVAAAASRSLSANPPFREDDEYSPPPSPYVHQSRRISSSLQKYRKNHQQQQVRRDALKSLLFFTRETDSEN